MADKERLLAAGGLLANASTEQDEKFSRGAKRLMGRVSGVDHLGFVDGKEAFQQFFHYLPPIDVRPHGRCGQTLRSLC
jgi:hypothetical protein